jgi:hypothetical protein
MASYGKTGRRALIGGMATLGAAALLPWPATAAVTDPTDLLSVLSDPRGAARIGASYLALHPGEADAAALSARLLDETGPGAPADRLRRRIAADYAARRTVSVDGWILSATEARLTALAHLLHGV